MMSASKNKDLSWKLISMLEGPEGNIEWNKRTGALPVLKSAQNDPFYSGEQFKGWFDELADKNVVPTMMPTYLEEFAFFKDRSSSRPRRKRFSATSRRTSWPTSGQNI